MVRCKSNTRFFSIKKPVILTQTDTTVGFVSQNHAKLACIKERSISKPFIVVFDTLSHSQLYTLRHSQLDWESNLDPRVKPEDDEKVKPEDDDRSHSQLDTLRHSQLDWESRPFIPRIPQNQKNLVRRAKKTTFIVKNRAFRIDGTQKNSQVLRDLSWHYSTSANENSKKFDRDFCEHKADIIVEDKNGLRELSSSRLLKINNTKIKALR